MTLGHNLRWVIKLSVIILLFGSLITIQQIRAQEADDVTLSISPQILNISANPGDPAIDNVIRLTNGGDLPIEIETIAKNILPDGEEGAVDLTEDKTSYSLSEWITVEPAATTIAPKTTQDFNVSINVPVNGEPGGHFGTVVFKTVPPEVETGSAAAIVSQEIAPVILVSVAGDVVEEANIDTFSSTKSFWSNERPITFDTRINNTGNVHFKPTGTITIKNMFGNEVTSIPLEEKNVLPDSIRKITSEWSDPGFAVGRYTADLSLVYGEDDTILVASTSFTIFPWQTLVPVGLVAIALIYLLIKFRSRLGAAISVLAGRN